MVIHDDDDDDEPNQTFKQLWFRWTIEYFDETHQIMWAADQITKLLIYNILLEHEKDIKKVKK
jgi:hypothetical protein